VPPKRRVLSPEEAYLVTSLMRSVVKDGTGKRAASLGRPVVGKTGTTNDVKDAWFSGYSTELVATVWVGFDDPTPLGGGESGAATALPLWIQFMKAAHEGRPVSDFPRPNAIVTARIDPATGLLAYDGQLDSIDEEFLDGTVPSETASPSPPGTEATAVDDEARASAAGGGAPSSPPPVTAGKAGLEAGIPEPPVF
jgi:penicillin-binding protein 1A